MGEVEVDVELVAGQRPLVVGVAEQPDHPRAHHGDLRVEVAALGVRARRGPGQPVVADESFGLVDHALVEQLAAAASGRRTTSVEGPGVGRRGAQVVEGAPPARRGCVRIDTSRSSQAVAVWRRHSRAVGMSRPAPDAPTPRLRRWEAVAHFDWNVRSCGWHGHVTWAPTEAGARRPAARRDRRRRGLALPALRVVRARGAARARAGRGRADRAARQGAARRVHPAAAGGRAVHPRRTAGRAGVRHLPVRRRAGLAASGSSTTTCRASSRSPTSSASTCRRPARSS